MTRKAKPTIATVDHLITAATTLTDRELADLIMQAHVLLLTRCEDALEPETREGMMRLIEKIDECTSTLLFTIQGQADPVVRSTGAPRCTPRKGFL